MSSRINWIKYKKRYTNWPERYPPHTWGFLPGLGIPVHFEYFTGRYHLVMDDMKFTFRSRKKMEDQVIELLDSIKEKTLTLLDTIEDARR